MGIIAGIDLGTTNTVISVQSTSPEVVQLKDGSFSTMSCVLYDESAQCESIGSAALRQSSRYPGRFVKSFKRLIGREASEPEVKKFFDFQGLEAGKEEGVSGSKSLASISLSGTSRTAELISADFLKALKELATVEIDQAVVTVPAYFNDQQKYATRQAVEAAGIKLLRLLPEPTAAAISYGELRGVNDTNFQETVLVVDFGGGTFDVSLLMCANGSYMEIGKGGDMWLGGDDIDSAVVQWILEKVCVEAADSADYQTLVDALEVTEKRLFLKDLKREVENAKIKLSSQNSASIELFGTLKDAKGSLVDLDLEITRSDFNDIIQPILRKVTARTESLLRGAAIDNSLVDRVVMVGGSSLIPAVQKCLEDMFVPEKVTLHPDPLNAIAYGAAIFANQKSRKLEDETINLLDTSSRAYYLQLASGDKVKLLDRNTPLPCVVEQKFRFSLQNQILASIRIHEEIDGIFEPVGQIMMLKGTVGERESKISLETFDRFLSEDIETYTLRFEINCENLISVTVIQEGVAASESGVKIVRDNRIQKLFQKLESTVDKHMQDQAKFQNVSALIAPQLSKINSVGDSVNNEELRNKLFVECDHSLEVLDEVMNNWRGIAVFLVEEALTAVEIAHELYGEGAELAYVANTANDLNRELHSLTSFAEVLNAYESMKRLFDEQEILHQLARCKAIAYSMSTKAQKKNVHEMVAKATQAFKSGNNSLCLRIIDEIYSTTDYGDSDEGQSTGRDIQLV